METLKEVLMRRDGLSASEADERINEARDMIIEVVDEAGSPFDGLLEIEEIVKDEFGLEPDYAMEILATI